MFFLQNYLQPRVALIKCNMNIIKFPPHSSLSALRKYAQGKRTWNDIHGKKGRKI